MACFHPIQAWQHRRDGGKLIHTRPRLVNLPEYVLIPHPCGQCIGCRQAYARNWAMRIMHEASLYGDRNIFCTLTYAPEFLPLNGSLVKKDFQRFERRLRHYFKNQSIRFYAIGEYGDETERCHFHGIFFDLEFPDAMQKGMSSAKAPIYSSAILTRLWGLGHAVFSDCNFEAAAYCARYSVKKIKGSAAATWYNRIDLDGNEFQLEPEFALMSRGRDRGDGKPWGGIGRPWLQKYQSDVYPHDYVVDGKGQLVKPPRYYDAILEHDFPDMLEGIKAERKVKAARGAKDSTPARLAVREVCAQEKVKRKRRNAI